MTRPVRVLDPALADVASAREYYENQRAGLGDEFVEQFDATIKRIAANPQIYQQVIRDARRVGMEKFPYSVFFLIQADESVVVACLHQRRDPNLAHARVLIGKGPKPP